MKHKKRKDKRLRQQNGQLPYVETQQVAALPVDASAPQAPAPQAMPALPATLHIVTTQLPDESLVETLHDAIAESQADAPAAIETTPGAGLVSEHFLATDASAAGAGSLAQRLVAARDARGWSVADVASKLRLPLHVVQTIERGEFNRIGHSIYLRGYLVSYARLVGVPVVAVESAVREHGETPPQLVASGRISHSRYLIERYSGAALYVVLTGVIFVPLVMFAMNMGGDVGSRLMPLDTPSASAPAANKPDVASALPPAASSETSPGTAAPTSASAPASSADTPLLASFAPIAAPTHAAPAESIGAGAQNLRLSLAEASWVEIVDSDGKRLEYGILPAGSTRSYASDKPLDVRIGNTTGARVEVNGTVQDIAPFNHGNVAHFKLFASGKAISRTDS